MKKYAALLAGLVLAACHAMTIPANAQVVHFLDNQGVNPQNVTPSQGLPVNCVTGCSGSGGGGDASAANQVIGNASLSNIDTSTADLAAAIGSAIPAGTNSIGNLNASTAYGLQSGASTNATSVKGSAGVLTAMNLINTTTTIYYLRMYNLSSAPTCSSATGFVRTWPIPPAAASGGAGGIAVNLGAGGTTFSTGIAFCLTGGASSTDNTNAATGVFVNLDYR